METIPYENAVRKLLIRDWSWELGHWKPGIQTVADNPEIIPGNYTIEEALKFYGLMVEHD